MPKEFKHIKHFTEMKIGDYVTIDCMVAAVKPKPEGTKQPGRVTLLDGESQFEVGIFENAAGYEIIADEKIAHIYSLDLYCDEYREKLSPRLLSYKELEATPERKRMFLVTAPYPVDDMFESVIRNSDSYLVRSMFMSHEHELKSNAAGEKMHHAYIGGLLYHLYRMTLDAKYILAVKDRLEDPEASMASARKIMDEANSTKIYETLLAYKNNDARIVENVKAAVLLAKALQKVYYFYSDMEVIVPALIISIYAKYRAEAWDPYLSLSADQVGGPALFGYRAIKDLVKVPEEKEKEVKFCIAWAFEPIESPRRTKSANSCIVHFIMKMLEGGFVDNMLDREILLTATALHDIGKLEEMQTTELGSTEYTTDGMLFNHLHLGIQMVLDEAEKNEYEPRLIHNVVHCIASHHGYTKWDAIVEPQTNEAKMLFLIDGLDSQIEPVEAAMPGLEVGEAKRITPGLTAYKTKEHFK